MSTTGELHPDCELCGQPGGQVVWEDALCRVVRVDEPDYPGFCRVIWRAHVAEMTDLAPAARMHVLNLMCAVELALRRLYLPDKINLASLGNMVPHLHWHVIPRFRDDRHFPRPIWAEPVRAATSSRDPVSDADLRIAIVKALGELTGAA